MTSKLDCPHPYADLMLLKRGVMCMKCQTVLTGAARDLRAAVADRGGVTPDEDAPAPPTSTPDGITPEAK